MSHTRGPWSVGGQLIVGPAEPLPNPQAQHGCKIIASCFWDYDGDKSATEKRIGGREMLGNARLMASSPDLAKALADCLDALRNETEGREDSEWLSKVKRNAEAAIAASGFTYPASEENFAIVTNSGAFGA